jgi:hypothetical protein
MASFREPLNGFSPHIDQDDGEVVSVWWFALSRTAMAPARAD